MYMYVCVCVCIYIFEPFKNVLCRVYTFSKATRVKPQPSTLLVFSRFSGFKVQSSICNKQIKMNKS